MENSIWLSVKIWLITLIAGSLVFCCVMTIADGFEGHMFSAILFILFISGYQSLAALVLFLVLMLCLDAKKTGIFIKRLVLIVCGSILVWLTLFLFYLRNKPFPESLSDPYLWIVSGSYAFTLAVAVILFVRDKTPDKPAGIPDDENISDTYISG